MHSFLQRFECKQEKCHRSFSNISDLRKHMNKHHITVVTHRHTEKTVTENEINPEHKHQHNLSEPCTNESTFHADNFSNTTTAEKSHMNLESEILSLISQLYSISSLPRNIVQLIVTSISELFVSISEVVKDVISKNSSGSYIENSVMDVFTQINKTFTSLSSEYLRLKYFTQLNSYVKPESFLVGEYNSLKSVSASTDPVSCVKRAESQFISMRKTFKLFLEIPDVFQSIIAYIKTELSVSPEIRSSFLNGNIWKSMLSKFNKNNIVLPVVMYFDDFECCNPLGSRAGIYKIGAVYVSLACIPPNFSSVLDNIFLGQLFYSSDRNCYGNKSIFSKIIEEFQYLEKHGISIKVGSQDFQVYFCLALVLGDNLGLNSIMGFQESFQSNHFCRVCKASKDQTKVQNEENSYLLRTKSNYELDLGTFSFGVKEECIFHSLSNFHVTENVACDLMHDTLEGVLRYEMAYIIQSLINKKYFTLDELNNRIKYFKFSDADVGNVMPQIKSDHLKKKYIVMSASEMLALFSYFSVLVGDLIPENDSCWELYVILHQIMQIFLSRVISVQTLDYLRVLIQEHHEMYCQLFEETLKPKHHFLIHYPRIILKLGPVRYLWSMRYEALHKILKSTASSVTTRKNIILTVAIKQQLRFSYRVLSRKGLLLNTEFGPADAITFLPDYDSLIQPLLKRFFSKEISDAVTVSWVKIENIMFKSGYAIQTSDAENVPEFAEIKYIILFENRVYFIAVPLIVIGFNSHLQAYEMKKVDIKVNFVLIPAENQMPYNIRLLTTNGIHVISVII